MDEKKTISNGKRQAPPYVDYHAFRVFLDEFKTKATELVNKGYLSETKVAKSSYPFLLVSLRYLGLIDSKGKPTLELASLLKDGDELTKALGQLAKGTYSDLLAKPKIASGKRSVISRYFQREYGISETTADACAAFFVRLAKEAKLIAEEQRDTSPTTKTGQKTDLRNMKAEILRKLPDFSRDNWEPEGIKDVLQKFEKLLDRIEE